MSLIFEREQLMREVAEEESNVKQLKSSVDTLLGQVADFFEYFDCLFDDAEARIGADCVLKYRSKRLQHQRRRPSRGP